MNKTESFAPIKWMVLGLLVGIVFLSSFVYVTFEPNQPRPKITEKNGYESFQDQNRIYIVDATVKNTGNDGWVEASARIYVAGKYMRQDQRIFLAGDENKTLQFIFDISFWGAKASPSVGYRAWAVAA